MPPSDPTSPRDRDRDQDHDRDARRLAAARSQPTGPADDLAEEAELAVLRRLGDTVRSLQDDDLLLDEPPPAVWAGIAAAVEADNAARTHDTVTSAGAGAGAGRDLRGQAEPRPADENGLATPTDSRRDDGRRDDGRPAGPSGGASRPGVRPVTGLDDRRAGRRGRSGRAFIGVAAAVLLVVAIGVGVVVRIDDRGPEVLASADLEPLELASGSTLAQLIDADGGVALDIPLDEAGLPTEPGYYEVWLIDRDVEGMVSLGPVRADGVYDLPPDVSFEDFPIVDVSLEAADGVPTHSGRSVLRGTLTTDA